MKLTSISGLVLALAIASAPAQASLVGQSITMTTGQTGATTITGGQGPTTVISPGLEFSACAGPNSDGCVTSGLTIGVDIDVDTINFSFFGGTSFGSGTFTITLSGFTTNITGVGPASGSLFQGTIAPTSFTSSSITFTGTTGGNHFNAPGGQYFTFYVNPQAPVVTSQSASQGVCEGRSATYLASASGTPTPSVQWEESTDGGATYHNVAGATSTVLHLNSVTGSMDGNLYRAKFNNGFGGDVFSNPEPLAVYLAPHITLNPVNQSAQAGQIATFTAAATGTAPITVQWEVSTNGGATFTSIPGATSTTLSFVVGLADAGNQYRAVFTNLCSTGTNTAAATLSANQGSYLIRYMSNLTAGDSVLNITNTGVNGNNLFGPGFGTPAGNICVNAYAFSPDEQLIACCSCLVTPNGLVHLTANNDLVSNTLTGIRPNSIVVKLVATGAKADFTGSSCANSAALAGTASFPLANGALAWGTTLHTDSSIDPPPAGSLFSITETPFLPASLKVDELASITSRCTNIIGNGSSFGVCRSCRLGGLGGEKQ